jgi:hypothetical protein
MTPRFRPRFTARFTPFHLQRPRFRFSVPIGREMKRAVVAGKGNLKRHLSTAKVCCLLAGMDNH